MEFYYLLVGLVVLQQGCGFYLAWRNTRHFLKKHHPRNPKQQPKAAIIAPYKGFDTAFEKNFESLFQLDYPDYEIFFVVESEADPVYAKLKERIAEKKKSAKTRVGAQLIVAGPAKTRSQKVHNSLTACGQLGDEFEVIAFVDSDVCVSRHWLSSLVQPLRRSKVGASTGYRIYIPTDSRLSTFTLSAINTYLAFFMGPHRYNATWGGTMAITRKVFIQADIAGVWANACTDDYSLTNAVRNQNLRVHFVPACLVPSYDQMSWSQLFGFARRQFIITRVYTKGLWAFTFVGLGLYVLSFWGSLWAAVYLFAAGSELAIPVAAIAVGIYVASIIKGLARQLAMRTIMARDRNKLLGPAMLDIFAQPLHCVLTTATLIASACSRKIIWRGFRYHLHSPEHTEIAPLS